MGLPSCEVCAPLQGLPEDAASALRKEFLARAAVAFPVRGQGRRGPALKRAAGERASF